MFFERLRRARRAVDVRLTAGYAFLLLVSLSALFFLANWQLRLALLARDHTVITRELDELAREYAKEGLLVLEEEVEENMTASSQKRLFVRLADPAGTTQWDGSWPPGALSSLESSGIPDAGSWMNILTEDNEMLEVGSYRLPDGSCLQVGASAEPRHEVLRTFRETFALAATPVFLLGLLGGLFVARRVLSPLRELASITRRIEVTGEVSDRVPLRGTGDELDELASLFNGMLERMDRLLGETRSTLDDVAHDLRTPMTRLRGYAELALETDDPSETRYREALADTLEASDQVLTILNAIMDQAEAEARTLPLELEQVSLARLVGEVLELYDFVAEERRIAVEASCTDEVEANVDPSRMRQALANLVDNALKYTPDGGNVKVTISADGAYAMILVEDTGIGIPESDLPRIWDRLYRGERSRCTRGLGLGLSFVKAIVEAHGGRVVAESEPGAGTRVTVRLRRVEPQPA